MKPSFAITAPDMKINQHLGCVKSLNSSGVSSCSTCKSVFSEAEMGSVKGPGAEQKKGPPQMIPGVLSLKCMIYAE